MFKATLIKHTMYLKPICIYWINAASQTHAHVHTQTSPVITQTEISMNPDDSSVTGALRLVDQR